MSSRPYPPAYGHMRYKFPLDDQQPVVRIPIAGPTPFNTLVVVRGVFYTSIGLAAHDDLQRMEYAVPTNFKLAGFDQRVPPAFHHSTTAVLQMMQQNMNVPIVKAVDELPDGFFDADGAWVVVVRIGDRGDAVGVDQAYLSSWVLCYEPPPNPELPQGAPFKFQNYGKPPRYWRPGSKAAPSTMSGHESDYERFSGAIASVKAQREE